MKSAKQDVTRPYRQTGRAAVTEATGARIVETFGSLLKDRWFDDVTLDDVARGAGTTRRTVIRRFGGKSGLVSAYIDMIRPAIRERVTPPVGDIEGCVDRVLTLYEELGDNVIRSLAQEPRVPELKPLLQLGRREHRAITAATFAPWLRKPGGSAAKHLLDALVIVTDIYVWKLLRRDMGRSRAETRAVMLGLVRGVLAGSSK